jgi:hypothetical protein
MAAAMPGALLRLTLRTGMTAVKALGQGAAAAVVALTAQVKAQQTT